MSGSKSKRKIHFIPKFIGMGEADFSINLIYRKSNIHKVSAALIAIDLELLGVIKPRKHGLIGKRLDGDYDDWFEEFKKNKELLLCNS
ncbi:hypothetical protein ACQKNX_04690 [Lysinibacillus sp. NPDC093712]|uniref:hypothetical protein n=1 Tax=Lysinibacillus sp. NPDC093712 TaxID=3390579 RepID=UPI003D06234D